VYDISVAKQFLEPKPELIERVINIQDRYEHDITYLREQVEGAQKSGLNEGFMEVLMAGGSWDSAAKFQKVLQSMHINISQSRLKRIMRWIDEVHGNQDGIVTAIEFFKAIEINIPALDQLQVLLLLLK